MNTPHKINSTWHELVGITVASSLLLAAGFGVVACGNGPAAPAGVETPALIETPAPIKTPTPTCNETALAAVDLSGQCRGVPWATMGALAAVAG